MQKIRLNKELTAEALTAQAALHTKMSTACVDQNDLFDGVRQRVLAKLILCIRDELAGSCEPDLPHQPERKGEFNNKTA